MIFAVGQVVLSFIAGFAVFRLWQRIAASGRTVFWLVTLGLLVRAAGGVVAFWMSYLGLPVARSLQIGRGLWLFAIDALTYVQFAADYAHKGPLAVLTIDRSLPSPFFIQMLAGAMLCFGSVVSVAILLNLAAYLGCCAIVLSFGDASRRSTVFAIAVLSLSPSSIVWSLQPLKDVTFIFLIMAFFGVARMWQQLWKNDPSRQLIVRGALLSAGMAGLLYGIAGIRWYFGAVILLAAIPFAVMTIIGARARAAAAAVSLLLLPLSVAAFFTSAGPYIPPSIQSAFAARDVKKGAAVPKMVLTTMREWRRGFERSGGATIIGAGSAIRKVDAELVAPPPPPKVTPSVAAPPPQKATPAPTVAAEPPKAIPVVKVTKRPEHRIATVRKKHRPAKTSPAPPPAVVPAVVVTPPPVQATRPSPPAPARKVIIAKPAPTPVLPVSLVARLLTGTAAMVLPHALGQRLGIVDVRGGRGLWLFVEIDTIVFDIVLAFAIFSMAGAVRRGTIGAPVFWLTLLVTTAIGLALVYTVSNFGTLFRHRDMLLAGLVLLPLALAASGGRAVKDAAA
jgi:uncharacterized membrane protein